MDDLLYFDNFNELFNNIDINYLADKSIYFYIILFSIVVIVNAVKTKDVLSSIDKDVKEIDKDALVFA